MLPPNLDPADSKLDDPMERDRLARVFDRGLDEVVGFVLPMQRWQARGRAYWRSAYWQTRRGRLFLTPGDSPVGYRLPLASLPWLPAADLDAVVPLDPFAAHAALPARDPRLHSPERSSWLLSGQRPPPRATATLAPALFP